MPRWASLCSVLPQILSASRCNDESNQIRTSQGAAVLQSKGSIHIQRWGFPPCQRAPLRGTAEPAPAAPQPEPDCRELMRPSVAHWVS